MNSLRTEKLRAFIKSPDTAVLIKNEINVGYFSGFHHSEGVFLLTSDKAYLLVDFRYFEAAQKFAVGCEVICFKKLIADISEILKKECVTKIVAEADTFTVAENDLYKEHFAEKGIEFYCDSALDKAVSNIRIIKDKSEFDKILKAQQIAEKTYNEVLNYIKPGVSERKIAVEFEYLMKQYGAERVSFDLITITGSKTSLPHGVPSDDAVKSGDLFTMDFGAVYDGYHSDTTRTVAVNFATDEQREIYNIVLKAQLAVLDEVKAGKTCSEIDKIARNIITEAGYGECFGHSTGHGVGLEIHELPNVSPRGEIILEEGMVITDEPGIYLPKKFGVRIEDMLYVTEKGYNNFVSLPKELIIL